jgi:hypothetical protein
MDTDGPGNGHSAEAVKPGNVTRAALPSIAIPRYPGACHGPHAPVIATPRPWRPSGPNGRGRIIALRPKKGSNVVDDLDALGLVVDLVVEVRINDQALVD